MFIGGNSFLCSATTEQVDSQLLTLLSYTIGARHSGLRLRANQFILK
jgi:hypothetical protein